MKPRTEVILILIVSALIFRFAQQVWAAKYLWQVALEEIEGSMQHEY